MSLHPRNLQSCVCWRVFTSLRGAWHYAHVRVCTSSDAYQGGLWVKTRVQTRAREASRPLASGVKTHARRD
jgi:hypothetical protein